MRTSSILAASLIVAIILGRVAAVSLAESQYTLKNAIYVKITYNQKVINNGPGTLSTLNVYMLPPVNTSRQKVLKFLSERPADSIVEDEWGQRIFNHSFQNVQAGQTISVTWVALVELSEINYDVSPSNVGTLSEIPAEILELYTKDDVMYDISNQIVQNAASDAVGSETNLYHMVLKIHDYVIGHLTYEMDSQWEPAPAILAQGKGSCSEYTCVFIAMCRAKGIPARFGGGSASRDPYQTKVDTAGHRWQEVYIPKYGWLPIDVTWDDRSKQSERYLHFLRMPNTHLTMATAGGSSKYMEWRYNSNVVYQKASDTKVTRSWSCVWEPATPNTPIPELVQPMSILVAAMTLGFFLLRSRQSRRSS